MGRYINVFTGPNTDIRNFHENWFKPGMKKWRNDGQWKWRWWSSLAWVKRSDTKEKWLQDEADYFVMNQKTDSNDEVMHVERNKWLLVFKEEQNGGRSETVGRKLRGSLLYHTAVSVIISPYVFFFIRYLLSGTRFRPQWTQYSKVPAQWHLFEVYDLKSLFYLEHNSVQQWHNLTCVVTVS